MKVRVLERLGNKENHIIFEEAAKFFLKTLLPGLTEDLEIKIALRSSTLDKDVHGDIVPWGNFNTTVPSDLVNPKSFTITINKSKDDILEQLSTLAHECIHLKQFVKKQLKWRVNVDEDGNGSLKVTWNNRAYVGVAYRNLPWEKAAFSQERDLFESYIDSLDSNSLLVG